MIRKARLHFATSEAAVKHAVKYGGEVVQVHGPSVELSPSEVGGSMPSADDAPQYWQRLWTVEGASDEPVETAEPVKTKTAK